MNIQRRRLLIAGSLSSTAFFAGCTAESIFKPSTYTEEISSLLISQDQKKIVAITRDFHYVFDSDPLILAVLKEPAHRAISATFNGSMRVAADNQATIRVQLRINKDASAESQRAAVAIDPRLADAVTIELNGVRYASGGFQFPTGAVTLNRPHLVHVIADSRGAMIGRAVMSPITAAADGVIQLAGFPLFWLGVIFGFGPPLKWN